MNLECDFRDGKILFNYFNRLKIDGTLEDNEKYLTQNLLAVSYFNNKYIIDVGYYSKENEDVFIGNLIYEENWEEPQMVKETDSLEKIDEILNELVNFIYNNK